MGAKSVGMVSITYRADIIADFELARMQVKKRRSA
jgi:hypothetical protein